MSVCAIDPGLDGAYAIRHVGYIRAYPINDGELFDPAVIAQLLRAYGVTRVLFEEIEIMPGRGSAMASKTSLINYGRLYEAINGQEIGIVTVRARTWKASMKLSDKKLSPKDRKDKAISLAKQLFPGVNLKRTEKCKNDHDGMAEALLILEYGIRSGVLK